MKLHVILSIAVLLLAPLAVSTTFAQTPAVSKQQAVKKYPELAIAGSALNKAVVAEIARRKQTNPDFFLLPDWPMRLADELASSSTPAATPPRAAIVKRSPRDPAQPLVGAIRWDAWTGGWVTDAMEKTLGPAKYQARLPWFAEVKGDGKVKLDAGKQKIMDAEIAMAATAGLDYWAFLLYPESDVMSVSLKQYLKSRQRKDIGFCMILHNALKVPDGEWPQELKRMINLIKEPGYVTVLDGRPLVYEFEARPDETGQKRFDEFREAAKKAKLNPYCVFMGWNPAPDWAAQSPKGFDAVSHYARASDLPPDFAGLVREQEEWMWGGAAKDQVPYIPLVTTGWNKEPRKDNPVSWEVGHGYLKQTVFIPPATAGEIATHLQNALNFVKENPKTCLANAIIMYAWNEHDEGGWLVPTWTPAGKPDSSRLDALRRVLRPESGLTEPAKTEKPVAAAEASAAKVQDSTGLRKVLYEAIDRKRTKVKLPPGTYRMEADPRNPGDSHLAMRDVKNLEVDGTGVTLLIGDFVSLPGISLYNCKAVTLKGITIDAAAPVFSQGKVTKIAEDHSFYEIEIDPAYLLDLALVREKGRPASVFDPQTRMWKVGVPDFYLKELEEVAPRVWRLHLKDHVQPRPVQPGDPVAIPLFGLPAVTARHSEDLTYDGITVYAAGAMAFHEDNGEGNTRIVNCKVTRKPGTERLLSTNADGFWSGSMRKGPTVLNSTFQFMHDDGINVHGKVAKILAVDGKRVDLDSAAKKSYRRNDTALFLDGTTGSLIGERTVTDSDGTDEAPQIKVSDPAGLKPGCLVVNLNHCGQGFRVEGCHFGPIRGNGLILRSWNGVVCNNRIEFTANNGIQLAWDKTEGPFPRHIEISGNTIHHTGALPYANQNNGIFVGFWDHPTGHYARDIKILGNRISHNGQDSIRILGARDISVEGNTVSGWGWGKNWDNLGESQGIRVADSENVTQQNNTVSPTVIEPSEQ